MLWSFAQAQPCVINTCGCVDMNTHTCVYVWEGAGILVLSDFIFCDFLKDTLYSNWNTPDMANILLLPCLPCVFLDISCLSYETNFKCDAFHESSWLPWSFFLWIPIKPPRASLVHIIFYFTLFAYFSYYPGNILRIWIFLTSRFSFFLLCPPLLKAWLPECNRYSQMCLQWRTKEW